MTTPRSLRLESPTHVVLRSPLVEASEFAGYLLASRPPHGFALLDIRPAAERGVARQGPWTGVVPPARHMITYAPVEPGDPRSTDWEVVRADEPSVVISHLPEFLSSPEAAGQALRQRLPLREPLPILILNGGLVARTFPDLPAVTGRLMAVQKSFGFSIVLAADDTPREDYAVFDYVFDMVGSSDGRGRTRLRCARAPPSSEVRRGDELHLRDLDGFEGAVASWDAVRPPTQAAPDPR